VFQPQQGSAVDILQNPQKATQQFEQKQQEEKKLVDNAYQTIAKTGSKTPFSPKTLQKVDNRVRQEQEQAKDTKSRNASVFDKVSSFADTGADKLAGGFARGFLRGLDYLVPGVDTLGTQNLREFADEWDTRAQISRAQAADPRFADAGARFGSTVKGVGDVGLMVVPSAAASKAAKASNIYQRAMQGNKVVRTGAQVAENVVTGLPASGIDLLQEAGRGNDPNIARSVGTGVATDAALPLLGTASRAIRRLSGLNGLDTLDNITRNADNAVSPGSPGAVVDAPQTPSPTGKVDIIPGQSNGVKINAPEPVVRPPQADVPTVRPDFPTELPPVRPDIQQPTPTFGEIIQPEPLAKAPVQQQLIPDEAVMPPAQPVREAVEQVQRNIAEQPLPEPEVMTAQKTPQAVKAEAEIAQNPQIVPVDNSGKVIDTVDETPVVSPKSVGEGAEVTVDADVNTGIAKTGEVGKSKAKSAKGREYDKTSREADLARGASEASKMDYETFVNNTAKSDTPTLRDRSIAENMQNRFIRTDPEWRKLSTIRGEADTELGQGLATTARTIRKKADAKQLTDRFANKLYAVMDDNQVVTKGVFDSVDEKTQAFVKARDEVGKVQDQFLADPSDANFKKFMKAFDELDKADSAAKFEEYNIASEFLEKSKNEKAIKYLDGLKRDAGVYMMDGPDAALLSSTRTMLNNFINTLGIAGEELGFGKAGSKVAGMFKFTKDLNIGGGSLKGWKLGTKVGNTNLKKDVALRNMARGNKTWNAYKNIVTTGNTLGERNISGAIYAGAYDHYAQALRKTGVKGPELNRKAIVQALTDPDGVIDMYRDQVLNANALGGTTSAFRTKFEQRVADTLSFGSRNKKVQAGAKLLTRATLGFPTVVYRSAVQGGKRTLLGAPSWVQARTAFKAGKPDVAAMHIKNAIKEGGSGATMGLTGAFLASQGLITGSYPSDPDERARWERDGITENAIKIGSDYYSLPSMLGSLALPFMVGANTQQELTNGEGGSALEKATDISLGALKTAINTSPLDSFDKNIKFWTDLEQGRDVSKYLAQTGSSVTRGLTPAGSLINQVAKMFDPTKNDTQRGDAVAQFISKVQDGFPGLSNMLPAKEVDGVELRNPSAISRLFGAVTTEQSGGVQKSEEMRKTIDDSVSKLSEYGAFSDGVRNLLDDEKKALLDKAKSGDKLDESDIKALMTSITKGVTKDGDTRFLENEQYDDNLAVLKAKRDVLSADPTTTQATLDDYDTQIKRGEIYKKNKTPYQLVKDYKEYSLTDWRKLGDPDEEDYDPDLYEALWQLDQEMTEAGVSRGKKGKAKYFQTDSKAGSGSGSGAKNLRSSSVSGISSSLLTRSGSENKYVAIDKPKNYIPDLNLKNQAKTDLKKSIKVKKGVQYI
jgi:hypothetical protein